MRHGRWVAGSVVLIALSAAAPAQAAARPPCGGQGPKRGELTENVRVVVRTVGDWEGTYACLRRSRRRRTFGSSVDCEIYCSGGLAASGRHVATYGAQSCSPAGRCRAAVTIVDVKSGKRSSSRGAAAWLYGFDISYAGTVGWIDSADANTETLPRQVNALTLEGEHRVLDKSPEIDLYSLAFGYQRLYWMKAGEPQTARVP